MTAPHASVYHGHRFPAEIIAEAVWLYFRFPLSFRMVEDMLAYRGIIVTHKTVREWAEKFGRDHANTNRRRTPRLGDKWHLAEAVITIKGKHHILWRAVDQHGFVLDVLVQKRRNTKAAKRFMRKLLSGHGYSPRVMVTDKLSSYGAGKRELGLTVCDHRQHKGLNN
ncbi:putative transposase [Paenochrobactrum gallinarii]|uniref:Putative transposase n=1 Tax=Paenochrobactrum gallinarii TaxID=643673 RepID=A0A841M7U4_9HYPH|nr:putative transposase [Paenochrobactrum gallinarii]